MRVAILDYGVGNLFSLARAFEDAGTRVTVETDAVRALDADALVLPGVGGFGAATARLDRSRLRDALVAGHACLGVCLGMQLLFDSSDEGAGLGLGLIPGGVRKLRASVTPHMGWNDVEPNDDPIFHAATPLKAYFANSYVGWPDDAADVIAWTDYDGERFAAAVRRGRTYGVQFHPEKSGPPGRQLIRNFVEQVRP